MRNKNCYVTLNRKKKLDFPLKQKSKQNNALEKKRNEGTKTTTALLIHMYNVISNKKEKKIQIQKQKNNYGRCFFFLLNKVEPARLIHNRLFTKKNAQFFNFF